MPDLPLPHSISGRALSALTSLALVAMLVIAPASPARARAVSARPAASVAGPACAPSVLNTSAVLAGTGVQVSPLPGSLDASPRTQLSFLGVPPAALSRLRVQGARSGVHSGTLRGYSQGDGASFVPSRAFLAGESVAVSGTAAGHAFAYRFTVSVPDPPPTLAPGPQPQGRSGDVQSFRSRRDLRPPAITVTTPATPSTAPGLLFAAPYSGPGQDGPMIFDNTGQLVWFLPVPSVDEAANLQVQQYQGRPVLTYWQGYIPPQGFGEGVEVIDDSAYHTIATVRAGNGYSADLHDFQLTGANTAYLTVFNQIHCNLTAVRGPANSAVTDGVFQQIDVRTGLVRQEWHSLDYVSLSQSRQSARTSTTLWPLDAFHINSVVPLGAGKLLVSSRSTWAVYVLNAATGQVLTAIGGNQSSVRMNAGTATAWQHDAQLLPDGTISIFDNGASPKVEPQSRGVLERLDAASNSVSLVRQYIHPGTPISSASQGNFQTLPNGDAFLGWGSAPYFTEFSPSGAVVFDARMPTADQSYRGYRFPWVGTPVHGPSLAVSRARPGLQTCMSWNGATQVTSWRVLAGRSSHGLSAAANTPRSGFETCVGLPSFGPFVQAQALGSSGQLLGSSATLHA